MREPTKTVTVNDIRQVKIVSTGERGDGLGFVNTQAVFVPGTKPGDDVKVKIVRTYANFAVGEKVRE